MYRVQIDSKTSFRSCATAWLPKAAIAARLVVSVAFLAEVPARLSELQRADLRGPFRGIWHVSPSGVV